MGSRLARIGVAALGLWLVAIPAPLLWQPTRGYVVGPADGTATLWSDPGAVERLDLAGGPGGRDGAPLAPFSFVEEEGGGTSPKLEVRDANGVEWRVKLGQEVQAEVFASRLAWASGYYVEPTHFVGGGRVAGADGLSRRTLEHVAPDGTFGMAAFKRKLDGVVSFKDRHSWRFDDNPFLGTRELAGLKILLMLTSNWDAKDARDVWQNGSNTKLIQTRGPDGHLLVRFAFSDWGRTMGTWGVPGEEHMNTFSCDEYAIQSRDFVMGRRGDRIEWGFRGTNGADITSGITPDDVRWLLEYLGRITDDQLRDALRASGADDHQVECFTRSVRYRVEQLRALV